MYNHPGVDSVNHSQHSRQQTEALGAVLVYQAGTKLTAGYYDCLLLLFVWLSLPCKAEWSNAPTQVFIFAEVAGQFRTG